MEQNLESVQTSHFYSCSTVGLGTKKIYTHGVRFAHFNLKGRYAHLELGFTMLYYYFLLLYHVSTDL